MSRVSAFSGPYNRAILEDAWQRYQNDPQSVEPEWQAFFAGVEFAGHGLPTEGNLVARRQAGAVRLIHAYRDLGHLASHINPLSEKGPDVPWLISLERFHLK